MNLIYMFIKYYNINNYNFEILLFFAGGLLFCIVLKKSLNEIQIQRTKRKKFNRSNAVFISIIK